jgi:SM-20-related protein
MTTELLNLTALNDVVVNQQPYPFFVIEQSLVADSIDAIMQDFPAIDEGGSFTLDGLKTGPAFDALIEELNGSAFRQLISKKLGLDLSVLPMIVTLRGYSREKDGRVHTDSTSKIATILIYFNEKWTAQGGKLRILNSQNMEDSVTEVVPNAGTMLGFVVTDDCWHGHPPFEGSRRSIQINFVADQAAVKKHHNRHGFTAKLKGIKKLFSGG